MSFILDALKKLERDKQAREPGVVMVGPVPWGAVDHRRRARTLVLATAALGAVVIGTLWWLRAEPAPTPVPRVDRDAATGEPAPPPPTAEPASAASTRPAGGEPTRARSATPRDRDATTSTAPLAAPVPRQLDFPSAETTGEPPEEAGPGDSPARETAASDPEFRLTAISTRDGEPIALLNDRLVREGDSFDGVRVLRIGPTDVEIEVDGERRTIGF